MRFAVPGIIPGARPGTRHAPHGSMPSSPLCPEGFAGPRGTRPLFEERRTVAEARTLVRDAVWRGEGVPDGGAAPVMLIPGFMAGDASLRMLAAWLARTGYTPLRSAVRLNVDCSRATVDRVTRRVELAALHHGRPITLIGHSLGGMFSRTVALRRPDLVAAVVTLGSPHLAPTATHRLLAADIALLSALSRAGLRRVMGTDCVRGDCAADSWAELQRAFPSDVPFLSLYSRSDGIVDWRACLDPAAEQIEVTSSHCGMPVNPEVYNVLADRLPALVGAPADASRAAS